MVDLEVFDQPFESQFLEDDADAPDNAGLVCNHVISSAKDHISARSCDILGKSVEFKILLDRELLEFFSNYLALDRKSSWRVDHHSEGNSPRSINLIKSFLDLLGAECRDEYSCGLMTPQMFTTGIVAPR